MSDTEREIPAEFEPTADQRALVQNAAAFGINQADIANQLNIDEKTLRKHFREELNSGKFGLGDAKSRSVLDERALVCGRHIFGWHFPFRVAQLRDARARGGKLRLARQQRPAPRS